MNGNRLVHHWQPRVQVTGHAYQPLGKRRDGLDDGLVQTYPDGKLDDHWAKTSKRVDARLLVEAHRLLGDACAVLRVFALELLEARLQRGHLLGRVKLLHGQRKHDDTYNQREQDDGHAEVSEQRVQEHERIQHGGENDRVPDCAQDFHGYSYFSVFKGESLLPAFTSRTIISLPVPLT